MLYPVCCASVAAGTCTQVGRGGHSRRAASGFSAAVASAALGSELHPALLQRDAAAAGAAAAGSRRVRTLAVDCSPPPGVFAPTVLGLTSTSAAAGAAGAAGRSAKVPWLRCASAAASAAVSWLSAGAAGASPAAAAAAAAGPSARCFLPPAPTPPGCALSPAAAAAPSSCFTSTSVASPAAAADPSPSAPSSSTSCFTSAPAAPFAFLGVGAADPAAPAANAARLWEGSTSLPDRRYSSTSFSMSTCRQAGRWVAPEAGGQRCCRPTTFDCQNATACKAGG